MPRNQGTVMIENKTPGQEKAEVAVYVVFTAIDSLYFTLRYGVFLLLAPLLNTVYDVRLTYQED